jgi:hypothetical protein
VGRLAGKLRSKDFSRTFVVSLGLVVVVAAGLAALERRALSNYLRELNSPHYSASPSFTLERFRDLRAGISEDQVRDYIGLPLERHLGGGMLRWYCTQPEHTADERYLFCVAIFDPTTRILQRTKEVWVPGPAPCPVNLVRLEDLQVAVGNLQLLRPDGSRQVLPDDGLTRLLVFKKVPRAIGPEDAEEAGEPDSIQIFVFGLELNDTVANSAESESEVFVDFYPAIPAITRSPAGVYKGDYVYILQPKSVYESTSLKGDLLWLIRQVAGPSKTPDTTLVRTRAVEKAASFIGWPPAFPDNLVAEL